MKSEWWYDGSVLDYETFGEHKQELYLVRLTVKEDGTAELLFPSGARKQFPTEEDASIWLCDEEFRRLEDLIQDFIDDGRPVDPRIRRPPSGPDAEIIKQMQIPLGPEAATAS